jgi:hypothetical protein
MRHKTKMVMGSMVLGMVMVAHLEAQEAGSRRRRIVVCIPERKMALLEDDKVLKVYSVAVGAAGSPSPAGEFKISKRLEKPSYYHHGKVVPPSRLNPLGTRWLGLNVKGYGIHGTNAPQSIGKARSHGCIRMRNQDVEELFNYIAAGDVVELHGEITEHVAAIFGIKATLPEPPPPTPAALLAMSVSASANKSAGL